MTEIVTTTSIPKKKSKYQRTKRELQPKAVFLFLAASSILLLFVIFLKNPLHNYKNSYAESNRALSDVNHHVLSSEIRPRDFSNVYMNTQDNNASVEPSTSPLAPWLLSSKSTILITSALGTLGTNLVISLYRTYGCQQILLMDTLSDDVSGYDDKRYNLLRLLSDAEVGSHVKFYRGDGRVPMEEIYDLAEYNVMEHIWKDYGQDITHVVHLEDHEEEDGTIVQGWLNDDKPDSEVIHNGPTETLLEYIARNQEIKMSKKREKKWPIQFLYQSSADVYHDTGTGEESMTLSSIGSMKGARAAMREMLAVEYCQKMPYKNNDTGTWDSRQGVNSVGLRMTDIFGPGVDGNIGKVVENFLEGSEIGKHTDFSRYNKAEVKGNTLNEETNNKYDMLYLDDAIDAIMAGMQYVPPEKWEEWNKKGEKVKNTDKSQKNETYDNNNFNNNSNEEFCVVFNIGGGKGSTITLSELRAKLDQLLNNSSDESVSPTSDETEMNSMTHEPLISIQSAKHHLGFNPLVTPLLGIKYTIAHALDKVRYQMKRRDDIFQTYGVQSCISPNDSDCMRGIIAHPCETECAHPTACHIHPYKDLMRISQEVTQGCSKVMYTLLNNEEVNVLDGDSHEDISLCKVAFVVSDNPIFLNSQKNRLRHKKQDFLHDTWDFIEVPFELIAFEGGGKSFLSLDKILKWSPRSFFSSSVNIAVYHEPDIIFQSLSDLLSSLQLGQNHSRQISLIVPQTILQNLDKEMGSSSKNTRQEQTYDMIHMGTIKEKCSISIKKRVGKFSWLVHNLKKQTNIRCNVMGEMTRWNSHDEELTLSFVVAMEAREHCLSGEPFSYKEDIIYDNRKDGFTEIVNPILPIDSFASQVA